MPETVGMDKRGEQDDSDDPRDDWSIKPRTCLCGKMPCLNLSAGALVRSARIVHMWRECC